MIVNGKLNEFFNNNVRLFDKTERFSNIIFEMKLITSKIKIKVSCHFNEIIKFQFVSFNKVNLIIINVISDPK